MEDIARRRHVHRPAAMARIAAFCAAVLASSPVAAQLETGAVHGLVTVETGDTLPGVTVELNGPGAPRVQVTDERGLFRFLGLDPGRYSLVASLDGFGPLSHSNVSVSIDASTELRLVLSPEFSERVTVDAETPLLDERKISRGTHISRKELEAIPTARDPWAILNQAPGVLTNRVDVGGTRATQDNASVFATSNDENDFLLDGVQMTDMASAGASGTYYDFDQFEEIQVVTGGSDITKNAAGITLNMVTRRGTNELRGTARFLRTDNAWQSSADIGAGDFGPGQEVVSTNELVELDDYGLEMGGPAVRDRLWVWGSYGIDEIVELALGGTPQRSEVESFALRLNGQLSPFNSAIVFWNETDKVVFDRGAGPGRAPETLWHQTGPAPIRKIEDTHVFNTDFLVTAMYSDVDGGFEQVTNAGAGPDAPELLVDSDGVIRNNFLSRITERPMEELKLTSAWFAATERLNHEVVFGGRKRDFSSRGDTLVLPGRSLAHFASESFGEPPGPQDFLLAQRGIGPPIELEYTSLWAQDTIRWDHWTLNVGVRYDLQEGANPPATVPANPVFPEILPAIDFPGNDAGGFDWSSVSPRLGVTYATGPERQTLIRASFARFAEALDRSVIIRLNPLNTARAYFTYLDGNDNNIWDNREIDGEPVFLFPVGFDPGNPTATFSPNVNDPNLEPGVTDELILGVEHALRPELVIGLTGTWRQDSNGLVQRGLIRDSAGEIRQVNRNDYVFETTATATLPDGSVGSADFYALRSGLSVTAGSFLTNGDRDTEYRGIALTARKRYADNWSMRGYVNWGDAEQDLPASEQFFEDPTRTGFDRDGDLAIAAHWSFNVNAVVSIAPERRWGFDLSGNLYGRQGYPLPYDIGYRSRIDRQRRFAWAVQEWDDFRLDDLITVDLGFQKSFPVRDELELTVIADVFNLLNEATEFSRRTTLNFPRADHLEETLSPRVWRFGLRLSWR